MGADAAQGSRLVVTCLRGCGTAEGAGAALLRARHRTWRIAGRPCGACEGSTVAVASILIPRRSTVFLQFPSHRLLSRRTGK
jgi:hypothetical protein